MKKKFKGMLFGILEIWIFVLCIFIIACLFGFYPIAAWIVIISVFGGAIGYFANTEG